MQARDIMTEAVVTASENDTVESIVDMMLLYRISAVPIVEAEGRLVGIVSEGDLMNRPESGTYRERSWWLKLLADQEEVATDYLKTHGRRAADVMTRSVVTATEDESAGSIAEKLERHRIKRVPVVRDGRVVGIVSRANLLQCFRHAGAERTGANDAGELRRIIFEKLGEAGIRGNWVNVIVLEDSVELWGAVDLPEQMNAAVVAAEEAAPNRKVVSNLGVLDRRISGGYGPV